MDNNDYQDREHWRLVDVEAERLAVVHMNSFIYKLERFAIRSMRVAFGFALGIGGLIIIGNTESLSDVPFAQLTLGMLVSNAVGMLVALGLIWWAFKAAFGAAPNKSDVAKNFIGVADATVKAARDNARMNT